MAFEAMFTGADRTHGLEFMEWEDKHHFMRVIENERLYLQGMSDGAQLVVALLSDPFLSSGHDTEKARTAASTNTVKEGEL
ncbi:hypothetical protein FE783_15320 [Paenibacillus mesophilus]|uniref:hypothetical protein n=1 Tax=Paenibacillus mesophilus TaxID=2582849 RepID=UPI00110DD36E|nr:hypothetical protein [Paenibacillus mesophilus]TMV49039.1 hypothetical protein FE783_15320 [Paenibacillus mesophilus]